MGRTETENFRNTLAQLKKFVSTPVADDRDKAGIIQAFEFTFEQCWKAIQKIGKSVGSEVGNPKQAFTLAIQSGWISRQEELSWLKLLEDRNLTSHTYKAALADEILGRIQTTYINQFEKLLKNLDQLD